MHLPHRIRIEQSTITNPATTGARTETWSEFASPWAHFVPLSSREFIAAGVNNAKVTANVKVRAGDVVGIDETMRVIFGGRTYQITGVLPDNLNGNHWITLPVSEVRDG